MQSMGSQKVRHDLAIEQQRLKNCTFLMSGKRNVHPAFASSFQFSRNFKALCRCYPNSYQKLRWKNGGTMNSQELVLFIVCLFKSQLQSDFYSKNKYIHLFIIQRINIYQDPTTWRHCSRYWKQTVTKTNFLPS